MNYSYCVIQALGTIPWQAYFQRVLSTRTPGQAQGLSFVAACAALLLAIPSVLIGFAAESAGKNTKSTGLPNSGICFMYLSVWRDVYDTWEGVR